MNFYKHHLGDYAAATVHLSWDEDCAYRRLLDAYYKREAPLPADVKEVCRLVRATAPAQRRAVDAVLREFFDLRDDGWHQKRCDLEIGAATAQAETNRRIAEEREARRRARQANESLNERGNESSTNRSPASMVEREPSQTPDSRLQTPDSRLQTPDSRNTERALLPPPLRALEGAPEVDGHPPTIAGAVCRAMRAAGLQTTNPGDPRLLALLEQGATEAEFVGIAVEAVAGRKGWAWVLHVLAARRTEARSISLVPAVEAPPEIDRAAATQELLREQAEHARKAIPAPEAVRARLAAVKGLVS